MTYTTETGLNNMATFKTCNRCEGTGRLAHFGHVNNGVCIKCAGKGRVMVMKSIKTTETHYDAITFTGERVACGTDMEKAEMLTAAWSEMNCPGKIVARQVTKTERIAA
jgi:DnaJ-class molecular chaperone